MKSSLTTTALLVVIAGLTFGAYFVIRYLGLWADSDTAVFARDIVGLNRAGRIAYDGSYSNGFAYPLWAKMLQSTTGVSIANLLQLYTPFVGTLGLALFSFAAYSALLGERSVAAVASISLFLVPEIYFTVSRGNHEKLTIMLTFLALLSVVKSYQEMTRASENPQRYSAFAGWVVCYYLCAFSLISLNVFLGSSLIIALTISLVGMGIVQRLPGNRHLRGVTPRLGFIVFISWLLVSLVSWYIYPKAGEAVTMLSTSFERFSALLLLFSPREGGSVVTENPYVTQVDWASRGVYRFVSSFRWIMFVASFVFWLASLRALLTATLPLNRLFLLALYGAFGLQIAVAVPMDILGIGPGSNLQVRVYTYFVLVAVPIFVLAARALVSRSRYHPLQLFFRVLLTAMAIVYGGVSLLKATLDPMISNRWLFYRPAEIEAIQFWDAHQEDNFLILDPQGRTAFAYWLVHPDSVASEEDEIARFLSGGAAINNVFSSVLTATNAEVWRVNLSPTTIENRVYDNGEAQLYHRVPRTPFQE